MVQVTDQQLVADYLRLVEGRSQTEAAAATPGVTRRDVWRWRRGDWKRLTDEKRKAIYRFVQSTKKTKRR
jgi:hypothetical protein